jgi:hypothetical protein
MTQKMKEQDKLAESLSSIHDVLFLDFSRTRAGIAQSVFLEVTAGRCSIPFIGSNLSSSPHSDLFWTHPTPYPVSIGGHFHSVTSSAYAKECRALLPHPLHPFIFACLGIAGGLYEQFTDRVRNVNTSFRAVLLNLQLLIYGTRFVII